MSHINILPRVDRFHVFYGFKYSKVYADKEREVTCNIWSRQTHAGRQIVKDIKTVRQIHRQSYGQADRYTDSRKDRQTDTQTVIQINRQAPDTQTVRQIHRH